MKFTKKQADLFIENLNHRMTKIEVSTKWIKFIIGYLATITTIGVAKIFS